MDIYHHNNLFLKNKYYHWYYSIIEKALIQSRNKSEDYFESHHILPQCMFPEYSKKCSWNTVLLTAKEHFIVHLLLPKMCIHHYHRNKMTCAINAMMRNSNNQIRYSSKLFSLYRKQHALAIKELLTNKPKKSIENYKGPKTENHRKNISLGKTGITASESHKLSLKNSHLGHVPSKESRDKNSISHKGLLWWNNGFKNIKSKIPPDNSWSRGRFKR
jgi:hypothetical protein